MSSPGPSPPTSPDLLERAVLGDERRDHALALAGSPGPGIALGRCDAQDAVVLRHRELADQSAPHLAARRRTRSVGASPVSKRWIAVSPVGCGRHRRHVGLDESPDRARLPRPRAGRESKSRRRGPRRTRRPCVPSVMTASTSAGARSSERSIVSTESRPSPENSSGKATSSQPARGALAISPVSRSESVSCGSQSGSSSSGSGTGLAGRAGWRLGVFLRDRLGRGHGIRRITGIPGLRLNHEPRDRALEPRAHLGALDLEAAHR